MPGTSHSVGVAQIATPKWDAHVLARHSIYQNIRDFRDSTLATSDLLTGLKAVFERQQKDFPEDWLLVLEIFEIVSTKNLGLTFQNILKAELQKLVLKYPEKKDTITDGLNLAIREATNHELQ